MSIAIGNQILNAPGIIDQGSNLTTKRAYYGTTKVYDVAGTLRPSGSIPASPVYWWDMNNTASYAGGTGVDSIGTSAFGIGNEGGGMFGVGPTGKKYYRTFNPNGTPGNLYGSLVGGGTITGSLVGTKPTSIVYIGSRNGSANSNFFFGNSNSQTYGSTLSGNFAGFGGVGNMTIQTGGAGQGFGSLYSAGGAYTYSTAMDGSEFGMASFVINGGSYTMYAGNVLARTQNAGVVTIPSSVTVAMQGTSTVYLSERLQTEGQDNVFAAWLIYDRLLLPYEIDNIYNYYRNTVGLNLKTY